MAQGVSQGAVRQLPPIGHEQRTDLWALLAAECAPGLQLPAAGDAAGMIGSESWLLGLQQG